MIGGPLHGSRVLVALLLVVLVPACAPASGGTDGENAVASEKRTSVAPQREETESSAASDVAASEKAGMAAATRAATTASEEVDETRFVHRAGSENIVDNSTYIDDPLTNGDPNAFILVTQTWEDRDNASDNTHEIGVWYDRYRGGKWAIFNQDLAPMSESATFRVVVLKGPEKIVQRAMLSNTVGNSTYIDSPLTDGHPKAVLSVTQNWNPGGGDGTYNDNPVRVRYDDDRGEWAIYNEGSSAMPDGAAFNVAVSEAGNGDPRSEAASKEEPEFVEGATPDTSADPQEASEDPEGFPEYRDFYSEGDPETPERLFSSDSSTGAIPAIEPFNFGNDPGGPEDKTLYLTIPGLGLTDVPAFDTVSEEKLGEGAVHIPATGYPWQEGANVYIAGHRVGYPNTGSYYIFFRLDELVKGDEILLEDSAGGQYRYRVTKRVVVGPDSVEVMNPVDGKSLVTLQTCTLPDYKRRLIVQGELVEKGA